MRLDELNKRAIGKKCLVLSTTTEDEDSWENWGHTIKYIRLDDKAIGQPTHIVCVTRSVGKLYREDSEVNHTSVRILDCESV